MKISCLSSRLIASWSCPPNCSGHLRASGFFRHGETSIHLRETKVYYQQRYKTKQEKEVCMFIIVKGVGKRCGCRADKLRLMVFAVPVVPFIFCAPRTIFFFSLCLQSFLAAAGERRHLFRSFWHDQEQLSCLWSCYSISEVSLLFLLSTP